MRLSVLQFITIIVALNITKTEEINEPESKSNENNELPSNYIDSLTINQIDQVCDEKKYIVIFFHPKNCNTQQCLKRREQYIKLARRNEKREIFFGRVGVEDLKSFNKGSLWKLQKLPQFMMSSFGWKKMFFDSSIKHLGIWAVSYTHLTLPTILRV